MCDRVGVLAGGRLVADGPPSKLRPAANRLRIEVDDEAKARAILDSIEGARLDAGDPEQRGVLRVELAPPATAAGLNGALVAGGVAVSALVPEQESLEDVFVKLVEGADVPR